MKKLKLIDGGMTGRVNDMILIQTASAEGIAATLRGLSLNPLQCILSGLVLTKNNMIISISEGYFFYQDEIFYVPAATFSDEGPHIRLFLEPVFSDTELRRFKNGSSNYVYQIRNYQFGYAQTPPANAVMYGNLSPISSLIQERVLEMIKPKNNFKTYSVLTYPTYLSAATAYPAIVLQANEMDDVMIMAAFNSTVIAGKLCTLPLASRPSGDIVKSFFANGTLGMVRIKTNGDVWLTGCSISDTNYVTVQFQKVFDNQINFSLPTGGGAANTG